jgi:hypothetical protein
MKMLRIDLKRLFSGKAVVALCLLAPVVVLLIFSSIIAPTIITSKGLLTKYAIFNEDKHEAVNTYINRLAYSDALKDIAMPYPVTSMEKGMELLDNDDVEVLIHVAPDLYEKMTKGGDAVTELIGYEIHGLDLAAVEITLNSTLETVGKSQNIITLAEKKMKEMGVPEKKAAAFAADTIEYGTTEHMNRRAVMGKEGALSLAGEYLPIEYYTGAIFALFAALAMLPVIHMTAGDTAGSLLRRSIFYGQTATGFFVSRILSGALFIAPVLLMLFPAGLLIQTEGASMGYTGQVGFFALLAGMMLYSLCLSSLAVLTGVICRRRDIALWTGLYIIIAMSILCGILGDRMPSSDFTDFLGEYLPMRPAMRIISNTIFAFDMGQFGADMIKLLIFTAAALTAGILLIRKRGDSL